MAHNVKKAFDVNHENEAMALSLDHGSWCHKQLALLTFGAIGVVQEYKAHSWYGHKVEYQIVHMSKWWHCQAREVVEPHVLSKPNILYHVLYIFDFN